MRLLVHAATYVISVVLKDFKTASYFPSKVRAVISDFAVVIAIIFMTSVDYIAGIDTPKLMVPQEFKVCTVLPNACTCSKKFYSNSIPILLQFCCNTIAILLQPTSPHRDWLFPIFSRYVMQVN